MHKSAAALGVILGCFCRADVPNPGSPAPLDIPRLAQITIDGNSADWGDQGLRVDAMVENHGKPRTAAEFDARFRLGWDDRGLLALFSVHDPTPMETDRDDRLWSQDSLELCLSTGWGRPDRYKVVISPGRDPHHPQLRFLYTDQRADSALKGIRITGEAARTTTPDGYILEVLFPWSNLGIKPAMGREVAFRADINDQTSTGKLQLSWYRQGEVGSSRQMQPLRLSQQPSPPVEVAVGGGYERFRRTRITAVAAPQLVGQTLSVQEEGREVARTPLTADGQRAFATLICPMPPRGQAGKPLTILVNGKEIQTLQLPNAEVYRANGIAEADIVFSPSVFAGETFPGCDFEHPATAEDLIGPYTLTCDFYNGNFEPVQRAEKPGRYGAVVRVRSEEGRVYRKYCTLYRSAGKIADWHPLSSPAELSEAWGVDPQVVQEQAQFVAKAMGRADDGIERRDAGEAVLLSFLSEIAAGAGPQPQRNSPAERNRIWWYQLQKKLGLVQPPRYFSYLPKDYDKDPDRRWPLVLSLHGGEALGTDMALAKKNGLTHLAAGGREFPFILIAPHSGPSWWLPVALSDLLDDLSQKYRVDADRIYITGMSMGGYGTWATIQQYPDRFAAAIPICGAGDPTDVARIKDLPVWVFHGTKDASVPVQRSREMVKALKSVGGDVRYTEYPEADHDSWTPAYATPELYDWMLKQHRGRSAGDAGR